ncbi:MAG: carboxypeptidase-like regulatory domain-containing protein [Chitinophagaceae bacterium]
MKPATYLLLPLFICFSVLAQAQITISGKVVDSISREPLQGASVFAQNTTQGTITNKDGEFSLTLKSGGYELILSFTGYQTQQFQITDNKSQQLTISMMKEDKTLGEVVIQSSNEVADGWEKYGDFFLNNFIGNTPFSKKCAIQNKDVVKFFYYRRSDKLKVLATEPIVISNDALGYDLRYQLDSFVYYYKTDVSLYRGTCFFSEKEGSGPQQLAWKTNRKKAYFGSKMQFMRSLYDSTVTKDGFNISLLDENDTHKFNKMAVPLAPEYYGVVDSLFQVELYYPTKFSVTYLKAVPEDDYLRQHKLPLNVGVQVSYIELLNPIAIKQNGYFFEQKDWINEGYWSWKNLADMLPFDYMP